MTAEDHTRTGRPAAGSRDAPGRGRARVNLKVSIPALAIIVGICAWAMLSPATFNPASSAAFSFLITDFGWLFTFATALFFFMVALAFSRYGRIRLGGDDEEPEFSTTSWIAMMFAAGMGIGLLFYGPYEPLSHYLHGVPEHAPGDLGAVFATTTLHFGPIAWATYAVVGCAIAYGTFRMGRPQLISAACIPLIGERRARGWAGTVIDVLAIFATSFGTAMSLGLGSAQIAAGMTAKGWVGAPTTGVMLGVIAVLSLAYLASSMSGVARGVRWLSNINMGVAGVLLVFLFVAGPTVMILDLLPVSVGSFLDGFFGMLFRSAQTGDGTAGEWLGNWTVFYWVWWVSWTPFVGTFLARISRGRTIREFVVGIILVPSVLTLVWFAVFGGTAIDFERGGRSIWGDGTPEYMLFTMLDRLPLTGVFSVVALILLGTFFVTTADSASTVMGTLSQHGRVNPTPWVTGMWGLMTTLIAVAVLLSGGTDILSSLQSVIMVCGSPFVIVVLMLMASLWLGVRRDPAMLDEREARKAYLRLLREQRARVGGRAGGVDGGGAGAMAEKLPVIPDDGIPGDRG